MFRIDRTLVTYDRSEYTSIATLLSSPCREPDLDDAEEGRLRAQRREETEARLQERIAEAEKEASAIVSGAAREAAKTLRQAKVKAAEALRKAEEKGYRNGESKAEQEMQARLGGQIKALQNLIAEAAGARDSMIEELEEEIVALILDTAKKVINIELEKNDNAFMELIRNALGQMKREGKIVVRVCPEDYASLFLSGNAEFVIDNERIKVTVMEEPLFEKGDCVLESEGETVNAGVSSQLRHIAFAFRSGENYIA